MTEDTQPYTLDTPKKLVEGLTCLRQMRIDRAGADEWRAEAHKRLEATPQWEIACAADAELKRHDADIASSEKTIRDLAIAEWQHTFEKRPAAGVQIKMLTKLRYDVAAVTEWARTHMADLLILDIKTFEKLAKVAPSVSMPVEVIQEPAAYIDTKL